MLLRRLINSLFNKDSAKFYQKSAHVFLVNITGVIIAFLAHIVFARTLGVEGYGVYIYVFVWVNALSLISVFGFDTSSIRFVSSFIAKEQFSLLRGFIRRSTQISFIVAIALSSILAVITTNLGLSDDLTNAFLVGCALLPISNQFRLIATQIQGFSLIVIAQLPNRILRPLFTLLLLTGMSFWAFPSPDAPHLLIYELVVVAVLWLYLRSVLHKQLRRSDPDNDEVAYDSINWIKTSAPMAATTASYILLSWADVGMVGWLIGTKEAGIYAVASRIGGVILFVLQAANSVAAPLISQHHSRQENLELQRIISRVAYGVFLCTTPIVIFVLILSPQLLGLFGSEFSEAYLPLAIIAVGHLANAACGSVGFLMTMTGHQNVAARIVIISALLNVSLNFLLIPIFGIAGAAVATIISTTCSNGMMVRYVWKNLRINPTVIPVTVQ
jgi:O-antigen/teichoic acid export membrane protein